MVPVLWRWRRKEPDVNPEDIVLALLEIAQEKRAPVTRTKIHKIVTIIVKELGLEQLLRPVPGRFGPYIPQLDDVLKSLEEQGLVAEHEKTYMGRRIVFIDLTEEGRREAIKAVQKLQRSSLGRSILDVIDVWADSSLIPLLVYVYERWPELTTKSEIRDQILGGRER